MKQMIVNALVSLFTGFFLVVGIGGGVLVVSKIDDRLKEPARKRNYLSTRFVELPASAIVETSVVRDVPRFTVRGSIKNFESVDWDIFEIKVDLLSKGVVLRTCRDSVEWRIIKPEQTVKFLVVCDDVLVPDSGELLEYRVKAFQHANTK